MYDPNNPLKTVFLHTKEEIRKEDLIIRFTKLTEQGRFKERVGI